MFRLRASVNPNARSSRHLLQNRQQPFEPRTLRHLHAVDECRNQVVCILQRLTNERQVLLVFAGTAAESVGYAVEFAGNRWDTR